LPKYTALRIIETSKSETIDGITAPWIRIVSQTGYTGWCFSGYVKQIESNVAEDIAASFAARKDGAYPGKPDFSKRYNVLSIDAIKAASGYYIQQTERRFQGPGHAPEILTLSVENGNVYIREIDVVNERTITRNEILLQFNGETYAHNHTELETQNGKIQIIYSEYLSGNYWVTTKYEDPYTFAGNFTSPIPDKIRRLTTDYLKNFAGRYVFASYKIIRSENETIDMNLIKNTIAQIDYNQEKKYLTMSSISLRNLSYFSKNSSEGHDFVETSAEEPFYWIYGEGVGFGEERFFLYKGGIAFTYEYSRFDHDEYGEITKHKYIKYVVFFKKE
jgi:hypothetical protein